MENLDLNYLFQKKYIAVVSVCLLLVMLALQGWSTTQFLRTTPEEPLTTVQTTQINAIPVEPTVHLAQMHLFGAPSASTLAAPETRLNIELKSTLVSPRTPSHALISVNGETHSYVAGDVLPGNAVIEEILSNKIVIKHNGQLETVSLQRQYPDLNQRFSE